MDLQSILSNTRTKIKKHQLTLIFTCLAIQFSRGSNFTTTRVCEHEGAIATGIQQRVSGDSSVSILFCRTRTRGTDHNNESHKHVEREYVNLEKNTHSSSLSYDSFSFLLDRQHKYQQVAGPSSLSNFPHRTTKSRTLRLLFDGPTPTVLARTFRSSLHTNSGPPSISQRKMSTLSSPRLSTHAASPPPLGPLSCLPPHLASLKKLRILLLVTSVNSFTQRVISYLQYLGFENVSVQLAISDQAMLDAAESWETDIVLCPFLTKKLPKSIHQRWITLVVHPGPPGDAGPSSLDWVLLGDDGSISDSTEALTHLLSPTTQDTTPAQRSPWGTICFQATEQLDGGAVWAWEQYTLPPLGSITKAKLYQGHHSSAAVSAVIHALCRVYEQTALAGLDKSEWLNAKPKKEWSTRCVSLNEPFLGGPTHDRPLLQATKRRPDWATHSATDVLRILDASDCQPGAMLHPLTTNSKSSLFAYGGHEHDNVDTVPEDLYTSLGYDSYSFVPDGKILATRQGAIFVKTRQSGNGKGGAGIWITHGRVPRSKEKPIDPKIPMVEAVRAGGHGNVLEGIKEWKQESWEEKVGEWQEVFVRRVKEGEGIAQLVYWNFYNGAFTTANCETLLKALQWATDEARGDVKLLVLMGGNYFSNGIALNTIENASSPGMETWDNIIAIDDIVSFLVGDTHSEVSECLKNVTPLCEKGIVTVACVRGNAAAGGVALAAACDVVIAARGVVLNPSYRGMGLHGSELHSYSYLKRCGPRHAATLLRDMKPLNTDLAHTYGLIDMQIGKASQIIKETEALFVSSIRGILSGTSDLVMFPDGSFRCAPWSTYNSVQKGATPPRSALPLIQFMCNNKSLAYRYRDFPALLHYRNEELSQMLLDSFHPIRSQRYHQRRYNFIRKIKANQTPARYAVHSHPYQSEPDPEDTPEFDDAPGWRRGEEWSWVNLPIPESLKTSEKTRIGLWYKSSSSPSIGLSTPGAISFASTGTTPATLSTPLPLPSPTSPNAAINVEDIQDDASPHPEPSSTDENALGLQVEASPPPKLTLAPSSIGSDSSVPLTPKEGTSKFFTIFGSLRRPKEKGRKVKAKSYQQDPLLKNSDQNQNCDKSWTADEFGALNQNHDSEQKGTNIKRYSTFSKATKGYFNYEQNEDNKFRSLSKRVKSIFKSNSTNTPTPSSTDNISPVPYTTPATPQTGTPIRALKALRRLSSVVASPSGSNYKANLSSSSSGQQVVPLQTQTQENTTSLIDDSCLPTTPVENGENIPSTLRDKRISKPHLIALSPSGNARHISPLPLPSLSPSAKLALRPHPHETSALASVGAECEYPCLVNGGEHEAEWGSPRKAPLPPALVK